MESNRIEISFKVYVSEHLCKIHSDVRECSSSCRANAAASYYSNDAAGEVVKPAGHL